MTSPHRSSAHLVHHHVARARNDAAGPYAHPFISVMTEVAEHEFTGDLLILRVSGDLDMVTSPRLRRNLDRSLPASTVIDLSQVTFLGAAGLRVLENAAARALAERRAISLVTASSTVLRILRLFAFDVRVPVYLSLSDAIGEGTPRHRAPTPD